MIPTRSRHPLLRDGTSQGARENAHLNPSQGLLDDRNLARLLTTAIQAAELVKYVGLDNKPDGTWRDFIAETVPAALASLSLQSARDLERELAASKPPAPTDAALLPRTELLLKLVLEIADSWRVFKRGGSPFTEFIERLISHDLVPAIQVLLASATAAHLVKWKVSQAVLASQPWGITVPAVPAINDIIATEGGIENLASVLVRVRGVMSAEAQARLESGIADSGNQPPHIGLVLAFLELFKVAQEGLDDLVRRHLEFYYTRKLLIQRHPALMDRAFAIFQPVKGAAPQVVPKGALLFAGKDAGKAEMHFGLVRDISVNSARVAQLRSTHIRSTDGAMLHATKADSSDGLGQEPAPEQGWRPMGHEALPRGRHGLAISAPILRLSGGTKTVTIAFQLASAGGLPASVPDEIVSVRYTGPKGWVTVPNASRSLMLVADVLTLTITGLDAGQIFAGYVEKTHASGYATPFPVVEMEVANTSTSLRGDIFSGLEIRHITITCAVDNDPHLILANDNGAIDGAKPFQPFGPAPVSTVETRTGSSFYVGSREIFSNRLTRLILLPKWKDVPEDENGIKIYQFLGENMTAIARENLQFIQQESQQEGFQSEAADQPSIQVSTGGKTGIDMTEMVAFLPVITRNSQLDAYKVSADYLDLGEWKQIAPGEVPLFGPNITLTRVQEFNAMPDLAPFTRPTQGQLRGFVRLTLTKPADAFGHATYSRRVGDLVLAAAKGDGTVPALPPPPVSPTMAEIKAHWTAVAEWDVVTGTNEGIALFHIEPHGSWGVREFPSLLPAPECDGALFIGLEDAEPRTNISMLLHFVDGSGDPFVPYPTIAWHYLSGDRWVALQKESILHDGTNELRRTGIFTLAVPPDITREHTRMPAGCIWLRASAIGALPAINRAFSVTAQAGEAVFSPRGNDLTRLAVALPAGSIVRLVEPRPGIKKVAQPLATSGGRTEEQGAAFHRRVSERLRHRGRAVSVWDYERLVLEQFPDVYLAKCVPHAEVGSELSPGKVMVVVIPKLDGASAFNPLKPGVSQDRLNEIEKFLQARSPGLAGVKVLNPLYEELRVYAHVTLRLGVDETVHRARLNEDLKRLLAPWAYGTAAQFSFTEQVFPLSILNFIEKLPYVDFVTSFRVEQSSGGSTTVPERLRPSGSRSILVSAPNHAIT